jgi:hypothetical protein
MHHQRKLVCLLSGLLILTTPAAAGGAEKVNVLEMKSFPDGNYLVNLQIRGEGPEILLNLEARNGALACVNSSDARLAQWRGRSMFIGNGVFMVQLAGGGEMATQFWAFRADGSAAVKEVPDRGEKSNAVPVKGTALQKP